MKEMPCQTFFAERIMGTMPKGNFWRKGFWTHSGPPNEKVT